MSVVYSTDNGSSCIKGVMLEIQGDRVIEREMEKVREIKKKRERESEIERE